MQCGKNKPIKIINEIDVELIIVMYAVKYSSKQNIASKTHTDKVRLQIKSVIRAKLQVSRKVDFSK